MATRYIVERESKEDISHDIFETLKEANSEAEWTWKHMNRFDKERERVYVIRVSSDDLENSNDWTSFTDYRTGLEFFDSKEIGTIPVEYAGGPSLERPGDGCDYMLAKYNEYGENYLWKSYTDWDGVTELYAERENPTWNETGEYYEDEDYCYEDLKDDIIEQAEQEGLHPSRLSFHYDD